MMSPARRWRIRFIDSRAVSACADRQRRGAKAEIDAMKELRTALQRADQSYWADRTESR